MLENYGQGAVMDKGISALDPGLALQSFVKHPLNILDVVPASAPFKGAKYAGEIAKAGKLGKTVKTAAQAFDAMGEVSRVKNLGKMTAAIDSTRDIRQVENASKVAPLLKGPAGTQAEDVVQTILRNSKNPEKWSKAHVNTWGHVYGQVIDKVPKEHQQAIMASVKAKMGITSSKQLKPEQLPEYLDTIRKTIPEFVGKKPNTLRGITKDTVFTPRPRADDPYVANLSKGVEKTAQRAKNIFTSAVLTQPGWITGNVLGDIYHGVTGGLDPREVIKYATDSAAKKMANHRDLRGMYGSSHAGGTGFAPLDTWSEKWFGIERAREQMFRGGAFNQKMKEFARTSLKQKGMGVTEDAINTEVGKLKQNALVTDEAIKSQRQMLGDYRSFRANEKRFGILSPFYKWYREATKIAAHQPFRHPYRYAGLRANAAMGGELAEQQDQKLANEGYQLSDYQRGGYQTGQDETGRPMITSYGKSLPIKTVGDLADMITKFPNWDTTRYLSPVLTDPLKIMTGKNFAGAPASSPNVVEAYGGQRAQVDPKTGAVTPLNGDELPTEERLKYLGSQILRDFTPAGTIERLLPYKTYDSQIFRPDPTRPPKPSDYLLNNIGIGSQSKASKIRNVDTAQMQKLYTEKYGAQPAGQSNNINSAPQMMKGKEKAGAFFKDYPEYEGKMTKAEAAKMYERVYYTGMSPEYIKHRQQMNKAGVGFKESERYKSPLEGDQ